MSNFSDEQIKTIKSKIRAMILGGALGDALGAPHEFRYQKKNYDGNLNKPIVIQNRWQGTKTSAVGQTTDDTEMTLCLWRSILDLGKYSADNTLTRYMTWANTPGTWAMGRNTRALFQGVKTKKGYESRFNKICNPPENSSQSNGSLMRCSPIAVLGLFYPQEWRYACQADCSLTNPNDTNLTVSKIYIKALISAFKGKSKEFIYRTSCELARRSRIQELTDRIQLCKKGSPIEIKTRISNQETKGWCLTALTAALWGLFQFDNYKLAIDAIIKCNGDTDTNAAIAGCLLGAFYGEDIFKNDITKKNIDVLLKCDTQTGDLKRPIEYQFNQITFISLLNTINTWIDNNR